MRSMTRAGGSSGIAGITWAGDCRMKMLSKLKGGKQSGATLPRLSETASQPICLAGKSKGRQFCTGLTTQEDYNVLSI